MWEIYFYIMKRQAKIWHSLRLHAESISNMPSDVNINMTAACKFRPVKMYVENILSQENSRNHSPIGSLVFVVKVVLSYSRSRVRVRGQEPVCSLDSALSEHPADS